MFISIVKFQTEFQKQSDINCQEMYTSKNYIEKPIHLVSINSFGKLVLHYEGISYLKALKSPISVLSIAGPYRTGKSFLLNSLISSTQSLAHPNVNAPSFEVGHTTNQTTHGLWIWSKPLLAYDENNQITNVIVMDSEGYASTSSTHDKRLITLAILLSTCFLYNSKGSIDKDSIFDLQFVIQVARLISQKQEVKNSQQDVKGSCDFHWILRDFQLQLINELGHKITPNEYMENCLLQAQTRVNQKTIETLKQYFPARTCHTLCHPTTENDEQQRPQFISQILGLKQSILKKNMKSFKMTGDAFIALLQSYIDAMNDGEQIDSVFQEGYDCKVRIDCLQKLNNRLKKLQKDHHSQEIDEKLHSIKSQIKQYYKGRMCSNKQIKVLDNEVEEMIQEYQEEHNSNKMLPTSVKCVQKQSNRHILNIPKTSNRMVRLSIQYSDNDQRSFIADDQLSVDGNNNNGRVSRVVERKSVEKQKTSPQLKALTTKIENAELKLHRTQLQLSTVESQLSQLKAENQHLRESLTLKEDELISLMQRSTCSQKKYHESIEHIQEQLGQKEKQCRILESQIQKITLLYEEKIQFLENKLKENDEERMAEFMQQKNKYKQKVKQLTDQIEQMKIKHNQQTQQVRQIFNQQQHTNKLEHEYLIDGSSKNVFDELREKLKENQQYKQQLQTLRLEHHKLTEELQFTRFKTDQVQESLQSQLQQLQKRSLQNQQHIKSIYEAKLSSKDEQISQLEQKIKSLNQIVLSENQKLIQALKEMEISHSEEKEDLFVMNNQLRNGCLEALQRVSGLKEQIEMKKKWCQQLQKEKKQLLTKMKELNVKHDQQVEKIRQTQKQLKSKLSQSLASKETLKQQLQSIVTNKETQLLQQQNLIKQLQLQLQLSTQHSQQLKQSIQDITQRFKHLEYQYHQTSDELLEKQHLLDETIKEKERESVGYRKELGQMREFLEEAKKQKLELGENIEKLNKQLGDKYESLEHVFVERNQFEVRKNQEIRELKQNQKKITALLDSTKAENIKLQEKLTQQSKQLTHLNTSNQALSTQLHQAKTQIQVKTFEMQQFERQHRKQLALSSQKMNFLQQKLELLVEEKESKEKQMDSKEIELVEEVKRLRKEVEAIIGGKKMEEEKGRQLREQLEKCKQQAQLTTSTLSTQLQHLTTQLQLSQKDNTMMSLNLQQLHQHLRKQQIRSQNHIRLYSHKLTKVIQAKQLLQKEIQKLRVELESKKKDKSGLVKQVKMVEDNYKADFSLWNKKFYRMEELLKEAGWQEYNGTSSWEGGRGNCDNLDNNGSSNINHNHNQMSNNNSSLIRKNLQTYNNPINANSTQHSNNTQSNTNLTNYYNNKDNSKIFLS